MASGFVFSEISVCVPLCLCAYMFPVPFFLASFSSLFYIFQIYFILLLDFTVRV